MKMRAILPVAVLSVIAVLAFSTGVGFVASEPVFGFGDIGVAILLVIVAQFLWKHLMREETRMRTAVPAPRQPSDDGSSLVESLIGNLEESQGLVDGALTVEQMCKNSHGQPFKIITSTGRTVAYVIPSPQFRSIA